MPGCSSGPGNEPTATMQAPLTVPLVGRWSFSEGAGQIVHDTSGNGLDGTLGATASADPNDPTWSADGPSLVFSPQSYVHVPGNASVVQKPHVAVELWVAHVSTDGAVLSVGSKANADPTPAYALYAGPSGMSFVVYVSGTTVRSPVLSEGLEDGRWHYVAGTYDGANVHLYVDGNEVGDGTPATGSITYGAADDVWIGDSLGDVATGVNAGLDAVSIYADALDPATVAKDAAQRLGVSSEIPVPPTTIVATAGGELAPRGGASMSVDDFGQSHYHVPIWVPPGRNGIQPNLSLDYSSRGGNDIYGVGWGLSGLSRITRCRKKISGGAAPPVTFTGNDGFCLDGQPLIGASADGTQFKTFKDDYSLIIAHDPDGSGPTWFEQRTKDGRILTYGGATSPNARIEGTRAVLAPDPNDPNGVVTTNSQVRFGWALSRVQDRAGSFMTVTYGQSAPSDLLPITIDYTGSAADPSTHRRLRFYYDESRPDMDVTYVSGLRLWRPDRLSSIEMYAPNPVQTSLVRVFSLQYATSPTTGRSLLSGVSECDGRPGGTAPTMCRTQSFTYTPGTAWFDGYDTGIPMASGASIAVTDVDADGKDDILYLPSVTAAKYELGISTGTGFTVSDAFSKYGQVGLGAQPADYNGDGHGDVVAEWAYSPDNVHWQYGRTFYESTQTNGAWSFTATGVKDYSPLAGAADVNGDHLPDWISGGNAAPPTYQLNLGGNPVTLGPAVQFGQTMAVSPYFVDVNGDGATDLLYPDPGDGDYATSHFMVQTAQPSMGDPLGSAWLRSTLRAGSSDNPVKPLFGDFNGDGLVDIFLGKYPLATSNDEPWYAVNTGQGFQQPAAVNSTGFSASANRVMDWNLDGKADLVMRVADDVSPIAVYTYQYDSSDEAFKPGVLPLESGVASDGHDLGQFQVLDANGDGMDDIVMAVGGTLHLYIHHGVRPDMLATATGSFGPTSSVTYKVSDQPETNPGECVLPIHCVTGRMWLVDTVSVDNGIGGTNAVKHTYQDGRVDLVNWGFLGFETHILNDLTTGSTTTRAFDLHAKTDVAVPFYPLVGMPTEEATTTPFVVSGVAATRTSSRYITYDTQVDVAYRSTPDLVHEAVVDTLNGSNQNVTAHITRQSFDNYGNLLSRFEQWPLDSGVTRTTTITYQNNVAQWLVSLPLLETVTSTSGNGESQTRQVGYEFDANGLLFRQTQDPGPQSGSSFGPLPPQPDGVQTIYTEYQRNADGSPTRVTTEDHNDGTGDHRYTQTQYDSLERMFPVVTHDTLDHTVQTAYHPALGVVAVSVDENGLTTTYQYDTFGRPRAVHPPTGDDMTSKYDAATASSPFGATEQSRAGGAHVVTTLDSLGRATATVSTYRFDGVPVYTSTSYDALGHVKTASRPYFSGATPANTTYTYDALGHLTLTTYPDGATVSGAAAGEVVATKDTNGNVKSVLSDSLGRPVKTTQVVGSGHTTVTQLAYGPFDTLETVKDTLGNVVQTIYDRRGRTRFKLDPDEGAQKITYDAFGERVDDVRGGTWNGSDVTGGGDTHTSYDDDGRVTSVLGPTSMHSFTWDTAAHGIGKTASVYLARKGSMGTWVKYAYDADSRLASRIWASSLRKMAEIDYGYDAYNRASTLTYPQVPGRGPLVVQNNYSSGGQLTSVTDASSGVVYWALQTTDASESFPTESFGNGAQTTWSEDTAHPGWLASIVTTAGGATVQNLVYHLENHERLHGRDDHVNGTTETFGYDGLNRLTQWTWALGAGAARTVGYGYDDIGNLQTKTVTGGPGISVTYTFDPAHFGPHQPSGNGSASFAYDSHGNQTTGPGRTVNYNDYDQPSQVTTSAGSWVFTYDAELRRMTRSDPAGESIYSYGGIYEKRQEPDGTNHHVFTISAKRPVAQIETVESNGTVTSETTEYLHVDHQGSVDTLTDAKGQRTPIKYEPFGLRVAVGQPWVATISPPGDVRTGFTAHEHDDDLGLIDMVGRVYDPVQQRFLGKDPVAPNVTNSQALNPYAYVLNDPVNLTDPTGLAACDPTLQSCPAEGDTSTTTISSNGEGDGEYGSSSQSDGASSTCTSATCGGYSYSPEGTDLQPNYTPMSGINEGPSATQSSDGTSGAGTVQVLPDATPVASYTPATQFNPTLSNFNVIPDHFTLPTIPESGGDYKFAYVTLSLSTPIGSFGASVSRDGELVLSAPFPGAGTSDFWKAVGTGLKNAAGELDLDLSPGLAFGYLPASMTNDQVHSFMTGGSLTYGGGALIGMNTVISGGVLGKEYTLSTSPGLGMQMSYGFSMGNVVTAWDSSWDGVYRDLYNLNSPPPFVDEMYQ